MKSMGIISIVNAMCCAPNVDIYKMSIADTDPKILMRRDKPNERPAPTNIFFGKPTAFNKQDTQQIVHVRAVQKISRKPKFFNIGRKKLPKTSQCFKPLPLKSDRK